MEDGYNERASGFVTSAMTPTASAAAAAGYRTANLSAGYQAVRSHCAVRR